MKLLTATREGQGERDGDFCHAVEGELVLVLAVCATDRDDPNGRCGCGRAFAGMSSLRATTTALVRDVDLTPEDLTLAVEAHHTAAGRGPGVLGEEEFMYLVDQGVEDAVKFASWWPEGTVLGRGVDSVHVRSRPPGSQDPTVE